MMAPHTCTPKLYAVTLVSEPLPSSHMLVESASRFGYDLRVLVLDHSRSNFVFTRVSAMLSFLQAQCQQSVVMLLDAYDVFFYMPAEVVLQRFRAAKADVVWSVERSFSAQDPADQPFYEEQRRRNNSAGQPRGIPYGFINSGGFMGFAGSLASLVTCAGRMADALARRACRERHGRPVPLQSPHAARESCGSWGLLVIGDTPGFVSLVSALPQLRGRVVATSDAGASGHTSFSKTCTPGAAKAAQSSDSHRGACARRTADPGGAWTRSMVDFYLAGLADGFATMLFSSFQASIGSRSLRISKTHHFGAMYSQQRSHRDRPMLAVPFLRAMMQSEEPGSDDVDAWPRQA